MSDSREHHPDVFEASAEDQRHEERAAQARADAGQQLVEAVGDLFINTTGALATSGFLSEAVERLAKERRGTFAELVGACERSLFGPAESLGELAALTLDESVEAFEANPSFGTADSMVKIARQYLADDMLSQPSFDALMERARRYLINTGQPAALSTGRFIPVVGRR